MPETDARIQDLEITDDDVTSLSLYPGPRPVRGSRFPVRDVVMDAAHVRAMPNPFRTRRDSTYCECGINPVAPGNLTQEVRGLMAAGYTAKTLLAGYPRFMRGSVAEIYSSELSRRRRARPRKPLPS